MNESLRHLLLSAGIEDLRGAATDWPGVLVLKNLGGIAAPRARPNTFFGTRGFNVLLLGPEGVPTHFCKCRPATSDPAGREIAVLTVLSRDPALSNAVPRTWGVQSRDVQLLISTYVPGTPFDRVVARLPPGEWATAIAEILAVTDHVAQRAVALLPHLASGPDHICLHQAARDRLAYLESIGFGQGPLGGLEDALRAGGSVPRVLQHGDLWPSNVVRWRGSWYLLDFEAFGRVQIPLYDACHLVRTCSDLRVAHAPGAARTVLWMDRLIAGDDAAAAMWRAIAGVARAHALSPSQVVGALASYLSIVAGLFHKRGGPRWYWEPHLLEARRLGELVAAGHDLAGVLTPFLAGGPNGARASPERARL